MPLPDSLLSYWRSYFMPLPLNSVSVRAPVSPGPQCSVSGWQCSGQTQTLPKFRLIDFDNLFWFHQASHRSFPSGLCGLLLGNRPCRRWSCRFDLDAVPGRVQLKAKYYKPPFVNIYSRVWKVNMYIISRTLSYHSSHLSAFCSRLFFRNDKTNHK